MKLTDILNGAIIDCRVLSSRPDGATVVSGYLLGIGVYLNHEFEPDFDVFKRGYFELVKKYSSFERIKELGEVMSATGFNWELLFHKAYGDSNDS